MTDEQLVDLGAKANLKVKMTRAGAIIHPEGMRTFAELVAQRERDKLTVMFLEAHEGAKDRHNYWLIAANKIKEST